MSLGGFAGFGSLCDNYAWILLTVSDDPVLKCFIFSKKCALFDWFFLLKSKYIDTGIDRHALKHNTGLFLVGTMKLKYTLSGGRVDAWPTLFFGEHSAVCVPECDWFHYSRDDISPRSVAMPVVVNKHSMAFILLVSSPLVCSGCTFKFSSKSIFQRLSLFVRSCKNTPISVFNHLYSRKDMKRLPSKMRNTSNSGKQKMPAGKNQSSAMWGYEGRESFRRLGSQKPGEVWIKLRMFFEILLDKSEVPAPSSEGSCSVLQRRISLRCLI